MRIPLCLLKTSPWVDSLSDMPFFGLICMENVEGSKLGFFRGWGVGLS